MLTHRRAERLPSTQHFSADGTLDEAWASLTSFEPKDDASDGGDDPPDGSSGDGHAERLAALETIEARVGPPGVTLGADKGYDEAGVVAALRETGVTPPVAQKARHSAIDGRAMRHEGYRTSQRIRKRIEEGFGLVKTIGGLRKARFVARHKTDWAFTFAVAADNLVRSPELFAAAV